MTIRIEGGDMRDVLARLIAQGVKVHAVVSDPPYHLTSIVKRFGSEKAAPAKRGKTGAFARASAGFMGQRWDGGDIAFRPDTWRLCYELLPPGGYLVAFGGTRTYHRLAAAIEDAGFDVRDCITWLYGSGFPKSHNVSKALDRKAGAKREVLGTRRADNIKGGALLGASQGKSGRRFDYEITAPATHRARQWEGWGTALKPAAELICLARKPLEGSVADNVLTHGTGALNIDGCRIAGESTSRVKQGGRGQFPHEDDSWVPQTVTVGSEFGRWPANVAHDGSEEVLAGFPASDHARGNLGASKGGGGMYGHAPTLNAFGAGDSGSAARFFYSAKADARDRLLSKHPTVKPVDLMRWLVRLVTPPGGTVLDPFAGSGSTLAACMAEGFGCIAVEREAAYLKDIRRRLRHIRGEDTPLFGGSDGQSELPLPIGGEAAA